MTQRWAWVGLMATVATGCSGSASKVQVLDSLPGPFHVEHGASPPAVAAPSGDPSTPKPPPAKSWLPAKNLSGRWRYIVVHHTAVPTGSLRDIDRVHRRDRGWENGCGYHFVIGNGTNSGDGEIQVGPRWRQQQDGAHTRLTARYARKRGVSVNHYNEHGIGIVLVGNLSKRQPTERQMESLARLVAFLCERCDIVQKRIVGHGDIDQTKCPGKFFSMWKFKRRLQALR